MISITDFIGLTGVALLIVTYALLQLDKIDPKGFWYSFNNLLVAILVTVSLVYTPNLASIVIEIFWFLISLYGVIMFFRRNKNTVKSFGISSGEQNSKSKHMDDIL